MTIDSKIKNLWRPFLPLGIGFSIGLSAPISMNIYQNHNVVYETSEKKVLKKVDGIFSNTEIEIDKKTNSINVVRSAQFNYKSFTDIKGDGSLDRIYLGGNLFSRGIESKSRSFYRTEDFEKYPQIFANSEREYKE